MGNTNQQVNRQIKGEIYNSLRTALVAPQGKSKASWTDNFIKEMLAEAKRNPSGALGQLIAKQLLQEDIISSLDAQTEKLLSRDQDFLQYRIYKQCYKEQRDVLLDETSKYIIVNTGRRTGKTNLVARWLVKKCVIPNSPCFYIHLKFDSAISQLFDLVVESADKAELQIESSSKNSGKIVFSNGSSITFKGNSNKSEADKLRGFKARGIVIDEAAFQVNEAYLVEDVLTPMMADYSDSQMMMVSTPPRIPHTYYEYCYRSGTWTIYEWNARKNPFIPSFDDFIKEICEKKGLKPSDPFIQREAEGKFVYDTEAQVFKGYKTYKDIPKSFVPTHAVIGIDYGFSDFNGICPLLYNKNTKIAYIVNPKKFNKADVSTIVEEARSSYQETLELCKMLNPNFNTKINLFTDTSDKSISFEMKQRYNLPVYPAYKHDKMLALTQLAEWCRTRIYSPENSFITDEYDKTVYKRDDLDNILPEIDDDLFHPDLVDALLYASRQYAFEIGAETGGQAKETKEKINKTRPQPINYYQDNVDEEIIEWS